MFRGHVKIAGRRFENGACADNNPLLQWLNYGIIRAAIRDRSLVIAKRAAVDDDDRGSFSNVMYPAHRHYRY